MVRLKADGIVILNQGKIVERGKHNDLLEKEDLYATLWQRQQQTQIESF